jgi:hypothetical protein
MLTGMSAELVIPPHIGKVHRCPDPWGGVANSQSSASSLPVVCRSPSGLLPVAARLSPQSWCLTDVGTVPLGSGAAPAIGRSTPDDRVQAACVMRPYARIDGAAGMRGPEECPKDLSLAPTGTIASG